MKSIHEFLEENYERLNGGEITEEDIRYMVNELLEMSKSDERAFKSYYRRIILHMLKYKYQPEKQTRSWIESILDSRSDLNEFFSDKSLVRKVVQDLPNQYADAKRKASRETGKLISVFPEDIPEEWGLENITDYSFIMEFLKSNANTDEVKKYLRI